MFDRDPTTDRRTRETRTMCVGGGRYVLIDDRDIHSHDIHEGDANAGGIRGTIRAIELSDRASSHMRCLGVADAVCETRSHLEPSHG